MNECYDRLDYSGPFVSKGLRAAAYIHYYFTEEIGVPHKLLVLGAGSGYEVVFFKKCGYNITAVDLFVPPVRAVQDVTIKADASELPFEDKSFNWVFSSEMMEHIPYDDSVRVLEEIKRVGKNFFLTIADDDDPPFHTHCNIMPGEHWIGKMRDMGFDIKHAQISPHFLLKTGNTFSKIRYKNGVMILGRC